MGSVVAAIGIGLLLGLLGSGGSIVAIPALIFLASLSPKVAMANSLAVVGLIAAVPTVIALIRGKIHLRKTLPFAVAGICGSFVGARIAVQFVPEVVQTSLLILTMTTASIFMFRPLKVKSSSLNETAAPRGPKLAAAGFLVGLLSGMVGVGGGFLIVPTLIAFAGVTASDAITISLLVISLNAAAGTIGYVGHIEYVWHVIFLFASCGVAGMFLGARVRKQLPEKTVRRIFAVMLILVAAYLLTNRLHV